MIYLFQSTHTGYRMRPLTEEETRTFFNKLSKYIGDKIRLLLETPEGICCFRLHRQRVYYVSAEVMKAAAHFSRKQLSSFGCCFGKFTGSGEFRLHITALDYIARHAMHKVGNKTSCMENIRYALSTSMHEDSQKNRDINECALHCRYG